MKNQFLKITSFIMATMVSFCSLGKINAAENQTGYSSFESLPLRGDINDDGEINIFDLLRYKKYILDSTENIKTDYVSDLNGDNRVGMEDICLLKKTLMGTHKNWTLKNIPVTDGSDSSVILDRSIVSALTGLPINLVQKNINHTGAENAFELMLNGERDLIFTDELTETQKSAVEKAEIKLNVIPVAYIPNENYYTIFANYTNDSYDWSKSNLKCIYMVCTDRVYSNLKDYINWIESEEGMVCIATAGYIPVKDEFIYDDDSYGRSDSKQFHNPDFVFEGNKSEGYTRDEVNTLMRIKRRYYKNMILWSECFSADGNTFLGWLPSLVLKTVMPDFYELEKTENIISAYQKILNENYSLHVQSQLYDINKDNIPELIICDETLGKLRVYSYEIDNGPYEVFHMGPKSITDLYSFKCKLEPETGNLVAMIKIKREQTNNIEISKIGIVGNKDKELYAKNMFDGNYEGLVEYYKNSDLDKYLDFPMKTNMLISDYFDRYRALNLISGGRSNILTVTGDDIECVNIGYIYGIENKKCLSVINSQKTIKSVNTVRNKAGIWEECIDSETGEYYGWINDVNLMYF